MSIIYKRDDCYLLSHPAKVNSIYLKVANDKTPHTDTVTPHRKTFEINPKLFEINTVYGRDEASRVAEAAPVPVTEPTVAIEEQLTNARKRRLRKKQHAANNKSTNSCGDTDAQVLINTVMQKLLGFQKILHDKGIIPNITCSTLDNAAAIAIAQSIQDDDDDASPAPFIFHGQNPHDHAVTSYVNQTGYLIPPRCQFYQNDVRNIDNLLTADAATDNAAFDLIVIDPPWWNRYVRRAKRAKPTAGYEMLDSAAIEAIPLERFVRPGSLVAIWCTNAPTHGALVLERLLPKWRLRLLATWYWVKVTRAGRPVCQFREPLQKQPFERLFVACARDDASAADGRFASLEETRYLFSVPSAVHSHKPPVIELFQHLLPERPRCLEIFARYLMPDCTSFGFEVLKLQNRKLFVEQNDKADIDAGCV